MSGDGDDDLYAKLEWATERLAIAEERYRGTIDKLAILDTERDSILAEVAGTRQAVRTLCNVLIERGQLKEGHRKLLERLMAGAAAPPQVVRLRVLEDNKHAIAGPDIDCASRLHLCRARCCTLTVELAREDIADGIRWEIERPYMLLHDEDGWCHYLDRTAGGCAIYDRRPATCRKFDCRTDARIWQDFEARIPAPLKFPFTADGGPQFPPPAEE